MQFSEAQQQRAAEEWSLLAGEKVEFEQIGTFLYAFGSELACLRLHYKFGTGRVGERADAPGWYFVKE